MILKKLTIQNFRSYFGKKEFNFSERLNLILGANGDGKTTFFDAMQWVFNTQGSSEQSFPLKSLVSAKFFAKLAPGSKGTVSVVADFVIGNNKSRIIEKTFDVEKTLDGKMEISDFRFIGYTAMPNGSRKNVPARDILEKERAFPAVVKKYCLFKGESELNIFKDSDTLRKLVELFSDIKDFGPYKQFFSYAEGLSAQAKANAIKKASRNNDKYKFLQEEIDRLRTKLKAKEDRRSDYIVTRDEAEEFMKAIEQNKDTIDLIHNIEEKISNLKIDYENKARELDENYSIKLLDDLWILYGFEPILNEFADKMEILSQRKQAEDQEYKIQLAQDEAERRALIKLKKQMEEESASLPWYIPNIRTMQNMIADHRCKVCNTVAPEGSDAYNFMLARLNEALEKKKQISDIEKKTDEKTDKPITPFVESTVEELNVKSMNLSDYDTLIPSLGKTIEEKIKKNKRIQDELFDIKSKIDNQQEKLAEILAQSDSIGDYNALWHKIKDSISDKENAVIGIHTLDQEIPRLKKEIADKEEESKKFVKSREAQVFNDIYEFITKIQISLSRAESSALEEFLDKLQDKANFFIKELNVDDFTGIINIFESDGRVKLYLSGKDGNRIDKPNTSLETTMHLSVLLAISELTKEHLENEYPLIFDAPTSTFDQGKDRDFYETLHRHVQKQCIVVTKSFLNRNEETGLFYEDIDALKNINAPVYRIVKQTGFDKTDLSTIETEVKLIKN